MQLTINEKEYQFEASFGFYKELNAKYKTRVDAVKSDENIGATLLLTKLLDKDVEALADILYLLNKNQKEVVKRADLESYIAFDADIDALFDEVIDFLSQANMTKTVMLKVRQATQPTKA